MRLLTAAESRVLDAKARETLGLSETQLIERAGREAALFAAERYGPLRGKRVEVLCGKGHNAADGLVAARHLAASGADVGLHLAFGTDGLGDEAAKACKSALSAGAVLRGEEGLAKAALIIDALLGSGFRSPLQGAIACLVEAANHAPAPVLALDLPSGLDPDSGAATEPCIQAEATLSFLAPKLGLKLPPGRSRAGHVFLAPLIDGNALCAALPGPVVKSLGLAWARSALPPRPWDQHKRRAELLVLAGSREYLGAALLCARAAYRAGAGLVRLALPEALAVEAMAALPEAVLLALPDGDAAGPAHLDALLKAAEGARAVAVGPGLGRRDGTQALVRELWKRLSQPAVFDADGLFALKAGAPAGGPRILTPHEGEAGRLLDAAGLPQGRMQAARDLAERYGAVALLKGPASLLAAPKEALGIIETGGPELASAGTGDVLCGATGALLAQGAAPYAAAGLGAWAQGRSGERWAAAHAGRGLLASDLADGLPAALAEAGA